MNFDFEPYFEKYQAISALADAAFERIRNDFSDCVTCRVGCSDCCHALFDLTFIEALYLNHKFMASWEGMQRQDLLEKANHVDRRIHKIKRQAQKAIRAGQSEEKVLVGMGEERVRCPLLNEKNECDLYDHRPVICRIYGAPLNIGGAARICSLTAFKSGNQYPTVHVEAIQQKLFQLSTQLVQDLQSKYSGLAELLAPVSMALITRYDEDYLGTKQPPNNKMDTGESGSQPNG